MKLKINAYFERYVNDMFKITLSNACRGYITTFY